MTYVFYIRENFVRNPFNAPLDGWIIGAKHLSTIMNKLTLEPHFNVYNIYGR